MKRTERTKSVRAYNKYGEVIITVKQANRRFRHKVKADLAKAV